MVLLVFIITGVGLLLRLVDLTEIPTGLHGDEAIVGLEGQRILREGIVDPYSSSALGQPTGPFYLSALTVWLFDNTVVAVRLTAVIFGTLAIPAMYLAVRRSLGAPTALLAATVLAVMGWHIHFSRIAFPLPSWPLWVVLTVGVMAYAANHRTPLFWAMAGAMSGLGIYLYNAHPLTLAVLVVFAASWLLAGRWPITRAEVRAGLAYACGLVVSLFPMLWFIWNNTEMYRRSITRHSVRDTADWRALDGPVAQVQFVMEEYIGFWWRLSFNPQVDYVDATGVTETVHPILLALALAGLLIGLVRRRNPLVWVASMIVLVMPFATVMTEQGEMRRTFVIAPFLAMFVAIAVVEGGRFARARWNTAGLWATVALAGVLLGFAVTTQLRNYYVVHGESSVQQWIFAEPFYDASMYMQSLSGDPDIYFLSDRWSIDYEPRRFLAPDARGEDRSEEFGRYDLTVEDEAGLVVFIFIGDYLPDVEHVQAEYPNGEIVTGTRRGETTFVAYEVRP